MERDLELNKFFNIDQKDLLQHLICNFDLSQI